VTELHPGCGHAWLTSDEVAQLGQDVFCADCPTVEPVAAVTFNATSGRIARLMGGQLVVERLEVA